MITAIEIENFKAFGERQRVELRPITLLFGPNSGGKSSVTHALHFLREVICERNLDVHHTWSGGSVLDLGGIRNFVHGRKVGTKIRVRAELKLSGKEIPLYLPAESDADPWEWDDVEEKVRELITSASVELEIQTGGTPRVQSMSVGINGEHFAELITPGERPHFEVRRINWLHPVLLHTPEEQEIGRLQRLIDEMRCKLEESHRAKGDAAALEKLEEEKRALAHEGELAGALADMYAAIGGAPTPAASIIVSHGPGSIPRFRERLAVPNMSIKEQRRVFEFESLLSVLVLGPGAVLQKRLLDFRYVGPLRAMPPRNSEPRENGGRSRWANGQEAWETLVHGTEFTPARSDGQGSLLEETSKWLEDEDRLDTGYRLELETFKQVPSALATIVTDPENVDRFEQIAPLIRDLPEHSRPVLRDVGRNIVLQPQDVGVGLSQIVPVIVGLLDPFASVVALEQPELHLHPRQQAALGDALIGGMGVGSNRLLVVETHSEHLILRVLRRIRESTRKVSVAGRSLTPQQLRVQYIRREGTASCVRVIEVDVNGDLVDPWPDDFFEQDFKERFS